MKILFITHYDNMYGANKALFKLVILLKKEYGEEPVVLIPAEGELSQRLTESGVKVMIHPVTQWQGVYSTPVRFMVKKYLRKRRLEREIDELYEKVKTEKPDLIYSNSSVIGTGAMLAERLGCRHIWHIREFSKEHFNMRYFYNKSRVRSLYEQADCLVAISEALKDNYAAKYPNAKIRRIYDGVSGDPASLASEHAANADLECCKHGLASECDVLKENPGKHHMRFCYVGYLFPMKHQEQVLEACERLNASGFTGYELYIVGNGAEHYQNKLKKKIEKAGLSQVTMTGYKSDVQEFLNTMDIGIIASEYEGFGLVTVEYMLHGMPVIGRNSGGTPELIVDTVTGYLYDDVEGLTAAMKRLMENPAKVESMGEAGRKRAKEYFTEEKNAEEIIKIIRNDQNSVTNTLADG